jgi:hypothetical protein
MTSPGHVETAGHWRVHAARRWFALLACITTLIHGVFAAPGADDLAALCADRAAVERVYYNHRTGTKPSFEETLPANQMQRLVEADLAKEAVLKRVYGVDITPESLAAEVQRINRTTRAPETLAELKAALGNDTKRFALTVAKPIIVERLLRDRFENDDKLHAAQRRAVEQVRSELLAAGSRRRQEAQRAEVGNRSSPATVTNALVSELVDILKTNQSNAVTETTWQLGSRTPDTNAPVADEIELKHRFGPDAQIISARRGVDQHQSFYFEDLPGELRRVLQLQLRQAGDVSAAIETPTGFLLYVCKEKTATILKVAALALPKRSYEDWLANEQKGIR